MTTMDSQLAIETIKKNNDGIYNIYVGSIRRDFLGGTLIAVCFDKSDTEKNLMNYVFIKDGDSELIRNDVLLLDRIRSIKIRKNILETLLHSDGVAAIIAVSIMLLIGYITISGSQKEIPSVLTNALTVILGFYFGKATKN
ncbi:hypothetical protein [Nitrospirillum sp. BR 11828]|uniref:hypothetical protein n=1 Tax=Nitrospirillum sp. BR 11828 TaxID=3104325 RepID=UPI002ACA54D1|nr:hypothetical protein [Nitrospirillum sp. BR 11828]MDZ5649411.1 hypothetical protein [Nitrospirillum sp. BR 11828]